MPQFKAGNHIVVRKDIDSVPEELRGKKGEIARAVVVKSTVGLGSIGEGSSESNSYVLQCYNVLFDGNTKPVPVPGTWMLKESEA